MFRILGEFRTNRVALVPFYIRTFASELCQSYQLQPKQLIRLCNGLKLRGLGKGLYLINEGQKVSL